MRIAIDVQALFSPHYKGRGVGIHVYEQLSAMFEQDNQNEYILFNVYEDTSALELFKGRTPFNNVTEFRMYADFLLRDRSETGVYEYVDLLKALLHTFLAREQIDVFFIASPFDEWNFYEAEWFGDVQTVATVYDVIPHMMPEMHLPTQKDRDAYYKQVEFLRHVNLLLANSESVRQDLVSMGFSEDRISVVYAGTAPIYQQTDIILDEQVLLEKYKLQPPFILCAGAPAPRKNLHAMVEAYVSLPRELRDGYQLLMQCRLDTAAQAELREILERAGVPQSRMAITGGHISDEELRALYTLAYVTFFASLYEGFGLPVVESMACGTPLVTSGNSSLGEITGDAAVLVDPRSVQSMREGLEKALTTDLTVYADAMKERVKKFTWPNTARRILEAFARFGKLPRESAPRMPKRVAVFTPLPPRTSGIADYSAELLPVMAGHTQLDVYIGDDYEPEPLAGAAIRVLRHGEFERNRQHYDCVLYQMGNSGHHDYMIPYIQQYGGAVELHDANLHLWLHFDAILDPDKPTDYALYERYIAEDYPAMASAFAQSVQAGTAPEDFKELCLNGVVTNYADTIIAHSEYAKREILRLHIEKQVEVIPHFAQKPSPKTQQQAREALGLAQDRVLIASFGSVAANRRLESLIECFADISALYPDVDLHITGHDDRGTQQDLEALVALKGLAGRVKFTGRLDFEDLLDYITATDIVVNLRWPYKGENSGIVTRAMGAGKPVIVTDVGSFGEIPDECCVKLIAPDSQLAAQEEKRQLHKALTMLITNETMRGKVGASAKHYADTVLNIEQIAKQILLSANNAAVPNVLLNQDRITGIVQRNLNPKTTTYRTMYNLATLLAYIKRGA